MWRLFRTVDQVLRTLYNIVVMCLVAQSLGFHGEHRFFQTSSDWVLASTFLPAPYWFTAGDPLDYADAKWTPERLQAATRYKLAASRFLACIMGIVAVVKLCDGCVLQFDNDEGFTSNWDCGGECQKLALSSGGHSNASACELLVRRRSTHRRRKRVVDLNNADANRCM
jgi:hypothetical protein